MKTRVLYAVPLMLSLAGMNAPASAESTPSIDALFARMDALTARYIELAVENEKLKQLVIAGDLQADKVSALGDRAARVAKESDAGSALLPGEGKQDPEDRPGLTPENSGSGTATSAGTQISPEALDGVLRQWVQQNAGYIFASVNEHLAKEQQASMPQPADFAARADELFEIDAIKVGASDEEAKIRMVMFGDYNCRFCREMQPVVEDLIAKNPDLQVVYRDMPILSSLSRLAAQAGRAAAKQGAYEEFHRELYKLPQTDEASILEVAAQLGLDVEQFAADMKSDEIVSQVTKDLALGQSLKIQGTPFFYVDGANTTFPGAVPGDQLQQAIDEVRGVRG